MHDQRDGEMPQIRVVEKAQREPLLRDALGSQPFVRYLPQPGSQPGILRGRRNVKTQPIALSAPVRLAQSRARTALERKAFQADPRLLAQFAQAQTGVDVG